MSKAQSPGEWNVTYVQDASRGVKIFAVDDARSTVYLGKSPNSYRRATGTTMYEYWRESVFSERACIVVQIRLDATYDTVFDMDNLVRLVGNTAFVGHDYDGHACIVQFL